MLHLDVEAGMSHSGKNFETMTMTNRQSIEARCRKLCLPEREEG